LGGDIRRRIVENEKVEALMLIKEACKAGPENLKLVKY